MFKTNDYVLSWSYLIKFIGTAPVWNDISKCGAKEMQQSVFCFSDIHELVLAIKACINSIVIVRAVPKIAALSYTSIIYTLVFMLTASGLFSFAHVYKLKVLAANF